MLAELSLFLLQSRGASFVAARDHGTQTVEQWLTELVASGGNSLEAIWSLYYANARSDPVITALRAALSGTSSDSARRAIDTILCQWRVPYDKPSTRSYVGSVGFTEPDALFPAPHNLGSTPNKPGPELQHALEHVIECLTRGQDVEAALDSIVHLENERLRTPLPGVVGEAAIARTKSWAESFAGSAYGDSFGRMLRSELARPNIKADETRRLLRDLKELDAGRYAAARWLLDPGDLAPGVSPLLRSTLSELQAIVPRWDSEPGIHFRLLHPQPLGPDEAAFVTEFAVRRLDQGIDSQALRDLHLAILTIPSLADRVKDRLIEASTLPEEGIGLEALRILGHLGVDAPIVRARYLDVVRGWNDFSEASMARFPCWARHDQETMAALEDAVNRADRRAGFGSCLWFGNLCHARKSSIAAEFLSDEEVRAHGAELCGAGFRGLLPLGTSANGLERLNQLLFRIATLQDERMDLSREEAELAALAKPTSSIEEPWRDGEHRMSIFHQAQVHRLSSEGMVQSAFEIMRLERCAFSEEEQWAARSYLKSIPLSLDRELELEALSPWEPSHDRGWWDLDAWDPPGADRPTPRLALELVPRMRLMIYGGWVQILDDLTAITPLSERDEEYLLAVLQRGPAAGRSWAVGLIDRRGMDTPRIRTAVNARSSDLDRTVRSRAQSLLERRGW